MILALALFLLGVVVFGLTMLICWVALEQTFPRDEP